ncbi:MAG: hypothetical protein R3360_06650 [Alphaproteobacteria bacterium]|nr:hypothetical protein [Alphaproteobacteria bacterium]
MTRTLTLSLLAFGFSLIWSLSPNRQAQAEERNFYEKHVFVGTVHMSVRAESTPTLRLGEVRVRLGRLGNSDMSFFTGQRQFSVTSPGVDSAQIHRSVLTRGGFLFSF